MLLIATTVVLAVVSSVRAQTRRSGAPHPSSVTGHRHAARASLPPRSQTLPDTRVLPGGAAGPPPLGAGGPPPLGAAGPPPLGAAGPPPVGASGAFVDAGTRATRLPPGVLPAPCEGRECTDAVPVPDGATDGGDVAPPE